MLESVVEYNLIDSHDQLRTLIPQLFAVYAQSNVYSRKCTFPNPAPEERPERTQLMNILQLLPEYIQYQYQQTHILQLLAVYDIYYKIYSLDTWHLPESPDYQIHPICQIHQKINIY